MVAQNNIFKAPVLPQNPAAAESKAYFDSFHLTGIYFLIEEII